MAITDTGKNQMLTNLTGSIAYMALCTDNACTAEVSGGSPAYARKAVTWGSPSAGSIAISNQPAFDVPAGTTVRGVAFYTALTGGTKLADYDVTDEVYAGQGTYTVTSATIDLNK